MSDGPHRSLPMRPWWKQVALRADKKAFDVSECAEAYTVALGREAAEGLRPSFVQSLKNAEEEPGLFGPAQSWHLQKLQAVTPLERRVLDNIAVLTPEEQVGADSFFNACADALRNEIHRYSKQIEEHYLRASGPAHARRERQRLDDAGARADVEGLLRNLLRPHAVRTAPVLKKKTDLDDGVSLS